ncbi:MAG TPA: M1 family aminopeptidase [bacterium]|nr:M1 family aminopeptidase [bacterium]
MNKLRIFLSLAMLLVLATTAWASPEAFERQMAAKVQAQKRAAVMVDAMRTEALASQMRHRKIVRMIDRAGKAINPIKVVETHVLFDADEAAGTIDTVTTLTIRATEDGVNAAEFSVLKMTTFSVTDGAANPLTWDFDDTYQVLSVDLPVTLNTGDEQTLIVGNAGDPGCDPDPFWGMTFCAVTSDIVFFTGVDWMPMKAAYSYEDLYSGGPIDIDIRTPAGMTAVTTADYVDTTTVGDQDEHHFVSNFDATYFGMAYADYATSSHDTLTGKPTTTYVHQGTTEFAQEWAEIGADIIDYYESIYSPYIYNKQDVIQTIEELGGGVGPQSATFYYASALTTDPAYWPSESIFSHEIAHSWWGNMIRMGDGAAPWLSEGVTEYSARRYGYTRWDEYLQNYLYEIYFRYFQEFVPLEDEVPMSGNGIYEADAMVYQAITYWKGAHFMRMLQWLLGDEDFLNAMSTYANNFSSDQTDELVNVLDLQEALEDASGADLQDFFNQWVYQTGYPIYRWAAQFDETNGGYSVRVRITQEQETANVYDIPLQVTVYLADQDDPAQYTFTPVDGVVDETMTFADEPRGLRVDDACWIWGEKNPALIGDVNSSNEVDGVDLIYVAWAQGGMDMDNDHWNYFYEADFNDDGQIDDVDYQMLAEHFTEKGKIDE